MRQKPKNMPRSHPHRTAAHKIVHKVASRSPALDSTATAALASLSGRGIALIGLMGTGKSTIGRRLAKELALPFVDSDAEIEQAAQLSIAEIFERFGEEYFRDGEYRVLRDILAGPQAVVATGGGAFVYAPTRQLLQSQSVTIWLDAAIETLVARTSRRTTRPLLQQGDPKEILKALANERNPIYAKADIHITSDSTAPDDSATPPVIVDRIVRTLAQCPR